VLAISTLLTISLITQFLPLEQTTNNSNSLLKTNKSQYWNNIKLSIAEKNWLRKKLKVRVHVSNWPPFMYWEKEPKGIAVDYVRLIAEGIGFQVEFIKKQYSFAKAKSLLMNHQKIDLIPMISNLPDRQPFIAFSKDYIIEHWVIITRTDEDFVGGLQDLRGKKIAVVKDYNYIAILKKQYPEINLLHIDTDEKALRAVATSQANAYIGNIAVATHFIQSDRLTTLKIAAPASLPDDTNAIGIRNDWPELATIFDKAFQVIPPQTHHLIRQKSLPLKYEYGISWKNIITWAVGITSVALTILFIIVVWNRRLKTEVLKRIQIEKQMKNLNIDLHKANAELERLSQIDDLTSLYNRRYFDEHLLKEWNRHCRSQSSLSLIMCDIDYFKNYNDVYGHLAGDDCIKQVTQVIKQHAKRSCEIASRYGGEEFSIILTETNSDEAITLAQSIRSDIEQLSIPHSGSSIKPTVTLSLGVATLIPTREKSSDSIILLADKALYQSKENGRNQVSCS